ncbi:MAG: hypothetical protein PHW74_13820 [Desulfobacca sp.]|nr:hypothetical protein [Desulfobacca sp.]
MASPNAFRRSAFWGCSGCLPSLVGAVIAGIALLALVPGGAAAELQARLVNKTVIEDHGPMGLYIGQVEIILPDGQTKLLPHWSYLQPQVVKDRVFILASEGLSLNRIYIYHARRDQEESFRLPLDLDPLWGSPSFSPDGRKIAYYQVKDGRVVVRTWPALSMLRKSPSYPVRALEVPPEPPRWKNPTTVVFDPRFFRPEREINFNLAQ